MSILAFNEHTPKIGLHVWIDPTATIIGDVIIGNNCSIWPNVVIRGDIHQIRIGEGTNVQDGSIIHVTHASKYHPNGYPTIIGNNVTIGHRVILHGCQVGDECLVGMNSTIMDGANIPNHTYIGANSLIPPNQTLQSKHLWLGQPAKKIRELEKEELEFLQYSAKQYEKLKDEYIKQF